MHDIDSEVNQVVEPDRSARAVGQPGDDQELGGVLLAGHRQVKMRSTTEDVSEEDVERHDHGRGVRLGLRLDDAPVRAG